MNNHTYDRDLAERLIPFLRSVTREIRERSAKIDRLDRALESRERRDPVAQRNLMQARMVEHRRALREAERELARLGCMLDDDHPLRVLIPGGSGSFEGGFAFDPERGGIEAIPVAGVR